MRPIPLGQSPRFVAIADPGTIPPARHGGFGRKASIRSDSSDTRGGAAPVYCCKGGLLLDQGTEVVNIRGSKV